jgi:uroporphyrinogen-III synthase
MADGVGPLAGVNVLVTRPREQAENLCALIEAAGGRALRLPLLDIAAVADPASAAELLNRPAFWDWLIFVSANAVRFALPLGDWTHSPAPETRVAAVGRATADRLAAAGIRVDLIPEPQFNSESLLASPEMLEMAGRRVLIVRGRGGREHLAEALGARGAEVAYAEVYRRVFPETDADYWIDLQRRGEIHRAVVTSGEALENLLRLLGESATEFVQAVPLAVIGSRIERQARERGWRRVASAASASDQALVDALISLSNTGLPKQGPD